ncbi:bactofilin family protein [Alkaliphilus hydrothermalis]|uniref:Cytoskeletal protein CcmA (Bactofilin family) n=1 Tax=Alkaliphilus hydrothermalis TaxID=1482730 RepID=A0ABS2NRH5_9FIRM|nr:polymer-forming cytoskeletal protein [Alkaliphilus hydrothermalis]MBM7615426.1 cytoskeletal protein CcmA (bactofilin family) [Alkaliphilus hydrothermalis]
MLNLLKRKSKILFLVIVMTMLGGLIVYGMDYEDSNVNILENQIVDGDLIRGANRLSNKGTVVGDLIAAANDVNQEGTIQGDLISAAADITVEGVVKGDLRLVADDIRIAGEVNRNASMFAASVLLEEEGIIDGSIHVFAGDLNLKGFVGGDIIGGAGKAIISGRIKGNVKLYVDSIELSPEALVEGNLTYIGNKEMDIDPARVKGKIIYQPSTRTEIEAGFDEMKNQLRILMNVAKILFAIAQLLIGLLLIRLFKKPYQRAAKLIEEKPLPSIGLGLGVLVATPVVAITLVFTIIGIPFSALILMAYGILIYLTQVPVALWLGVKILRDEKRPYVAFVIGSLLIETLLLIPYFSFIGGITVTIIGLGVTLMMMKEYYQKGKPSLENPILPEK